MNVPLMYQGFLSAVVFACAVMAIVNLFLVKRRGPSAYLLSSAFVLLGATVYAYKVHAPQAVVTVGGFLVAAALAADFLLRAGGPPKR